MHAGGLCTKATPNNLRVRLCRVILARVDNVQGGGGGSVRLYRGIWVLACMALCGATGAHTSELQAYHAIHRGDEMHVLYTHILTCLYPYMDTQICTHTLTHLLYVHMFPAAISTALQPN